MRVTEGRKGGNAERLTGSVGPGTVKCGISSKMVVKN